MTDLQQTAARIRCLPAAHTALLARLSAEPIKAEHTRRLQPTSTVPLNLETEALAAEIRYSLALAGEIVADLTGTADPAGVNACAQLIADRITALALLPWIACHAVPCREIEPVLLSGLDILDSLDQLYRRARAALGIRPDQHAIIEDWRRRKTPTARHA